MPTRVPLPPATASVPPLPAAPAFHDGPDVPLSSNTRSPAHGWREAVAFDHCRVLLSHFIFARRTDPVAQLYRLSLDEGEPRAAAGLGARLWAYLVYPFVCLRQMWLFFGRNRAHVTRTHHISAVRQLADLWHCAWRQNQLPRHYYWRKLYLIDRRQWLDFMEHRQVNTLLDHLNRRLPITRVINKVNFFEHCLQHGLPTPRVLAAWNEAGELTTSAPAPITADLFIKPIAEFGSVGIMVVPYDAALRRYKLQGKDLVWSDLLLAIGALARGDRRGLLLQKRLRNAPRNAIYGDNDICNARLITGLGPDGTPVPITAMIRLPSSLTTTGHDRNIMIAMIDVPTGRMHAGKFRNTLLGEFPLHPDTKEPIEYRVLPGWQEMIDLAARAHRTYPWMPFIGWDLVDTTDGVLLLEANAYWGADCVQLPGATPLGRTPFPAIYLHWYDEFYGPAAAVAPTLPA